MPAVELMSKTILTLKERPHVPLEAEILTPDALAPLGHDDVRALPVVLGKRQCRLDEMKRRGEIISVTVRNHT